MARYGKDRGARSISIGPAIPSTSPKENAGTTPKNSGVQTGAGDEFAYIPSTTQYPLAVAWDVTVSGGTLSALLVNLEVTDDDTSAAPIWSTLDSNNVVTGGRQIATSTAHPNDLARLIRANIATYTVASGTPVVTVGISC